MDRVVATDRGYRWFGAIGWWTVAAGWVLSAAGYVNDLLAGGGIVPPSSLTTASSLAPYAIGCGFCVVTYIAATDVPLDTRLNWLRPIFHHPRINVRPTAATFRRKAGKAGSPFGEA